MSVAVSKNISEILRAVDLKNPKLSTLASKGTDRLVNQFISENIDLGQGQKETTQSQLYMASFWGFYDVVKTLVERGADINCQNANTKWTPLHAATFQEHGKEKAFFKKLNVIDIKETQLHKKTKPIFSSVVMYLLNKGADPYLEDYEGRTPVDFASASDKIWALFAVCDCIKTNRQTLIEKGVLRQPGNTLQGFQETVSNDNAMRKTKTSNLIDYDNCTTAQHTNERNEYAAAIDGDVLAGDTSINKQTTQEDQPSFNVWRN